MPFDFDPNAPLRPLKPLPNNRPHHITAPALLPPRSREPTLKEISDDFLREVRKYFPGAVIVNQRLH
jgi:hypothetical protein